MRSYYFNRSVLAVTLLALSISDAAAQSTCSPSCPTPTPTRPRRAIERQIPTSSVPTGSSRSGLAVGIGAAGLALGVGLIGAATRGPSSWRVPDDPIETGPVPARPPRVEQVTQNGTQKSKPKRKKTKKTKTPKVDQNQTATPSSRSSQTPPSGPTVPAVEAGRPGFAVPANTERRYVPNEVLVVLRDDATPTQIAGLERALGLTPLATARIGLINAEVRRYRLRPGASVPGVVTSLSNRSIVTRAEPNFLFELQLDPPAAPKTDKPTKTETPANTQGKEAGPAQYALDALHVTQAQKLAKGKGVTIAVIDSGLDETNPDLKDTVSEHFDALGAPFKPHAHGTAIGGAIVASHKLKGIAPEAKLIAVRAFVGATAGANGTGFDVLRGLDFAAAHGAKIVNMSFAGPEDALLKTALDAARERGIVAIAAAGNGGPRAKPLYPAAEPGVIAVTATDADGKPFAKANRGAHVAVTAPGVDVIAPGLGDSVQITSGTSIAAAEASGVAALILERRPNATPEEVGTLLRQTATRLAVEPNAVGAGLINAQAAVEKAK